MSPPTVPYVRMLPTDVCKDHELVGHVDKWGGSNNDEAYKYGGANVTYLVTRVRASSAAGRLDVDVVRLPSNHAVPNSTLTDVQLISESSWRRVGGQIQSGPINPTTSAAAATPTQGVPSPPDDLRGLGDVINAADAVVGDRMIGWYDSSAPGNYMRYRNDGDRRIISKNGPDGPQYNMVNFRVNDKTYEHSLVHYKPGNRSNIWIVITPRTVSSNSTRSVGKVIDEYPGECPRCGQKAYVGAFEVAHADERAAMSVACPARRK